jgi:4-amino-4-deoxy-L-arabinose transferase-like glycosyltransferase
MSIDREAPARVWPVLLLLFAGLVASHWSLLGLPYYWDEAGYYIPAAWDFFRTGSLIPISTLTNAHPPLPSIYLALAWKVFSFCPLVTRAATLLAASVGLAAVERIAERLVADRRVAFWTVLLTALYPVWFAQSSLAHADIFAAAFTLWGLVFALPGRDGSPEPAPRIWAAALCFALAALAKETAIVVPLTLGAVSLAEGLFSGAPRRWMKIRESLWMAGSLLPLMAWYGWHKHKTGFLFGNPEFLRYNAQANLDPVRLLAALGHRVLHLTAHMNLFVPVLLAAAALFLVPRPRVFANPPRRLGAPGPSLLGTRESSNDPVADLIPPLGPNDGEVAGIRPAALRRIFWLLAANAVFFSVLGGALLTRYLLPMYPLVLLLAVTALYRRVRAWQVLAAFSAAAFVAGLFINPPYGFAPEDNLAYAHLVRLEQAGVAELNARCPGATVLSAWPLTDAMTRPELGYLNEPYEIYALEDFSAAQIDRAANEPGRYSAALVFSTKYDPQSPLFTLGARSKALDEKYFGLHRDLPPEEIARQLGGKLLWMKTDQGQWIALIRFNRQFDAKLDLGGSRITVD